jgi:hypothetical protein
MSIPASSGDPGGVTESQSLAVSPSDLDQANLGYPPVDVQSSERIAQMTRMHLRDLPIPFTARRLANGVQWRFELPFENIDPNNLSVVLTDSSLPHTYPLVLGQDYTADFRNGVLLLNTAPVENLLLVAQGIYYKDFLPGELDLYVRIAYIQHVEGVDPSPQLDVFPAPQPPVSGYGTPPPSRLREIDEFPMSLLASMYALDDLATMVAQEADVHTPDGVTIARSQIFQQLRVRIQDIEDRYKQLCSLLNIGLYRITTSTLRRISRTTNRLVPIYIPREIDDMMMAQRHLPAFVDKFSRVITDRGLYALATAYHKDDVVFEGGQRYIAIQDVPIGKDPALDVDPRTGDGFFWKFTTINSSQWWGYW